MWGSVTSVTWVEAEITFSVFIFGCFNLMRDVLIIYDHYVYLFITRMYILRGLFFLVNWKLEFRLYSVIPIHFVGTVSHFNSFHVRGGSRILKWGGGGGERARSARHTRAKREVPFDRPGSRGPESSDFRCCLIPSEPYFEAFWCKSEHKEIVHQNLEEGARLLRPRLYPPLHAQAVFTDDTRVVFRVRL